jgi:GNAT superfamily N-acetyltransferase
MVAAVPPGVVDASRWAGDVALTDGGTVHLRLVAPGDEARLVAFHERQSPDSVYQRYFTAMPTLTPRMLATLTGVDFTDHVGFVADFGDDIVAVGVLDRWPGTTTGEVAFMVDEAHRGRGLATLLLEYLVAAARDVGFDALVAVTLPSNQPMLGVFTRAGFETGRTFADGLIEVSLALEADEATAGLIERRAAPRAARAGGGPGGARANPAVSATSSSRTCGAAGSPAPSTRSTPPAAPSLGCRRGRASPRFPTRSPWRWCAFRPTPCPTSWPTAPAGGCAPSWWCRRASTTSRDSWPGRGGGACAWWGPSRWAW